MWWWGEISALTPFQTWFLIPEAKIVKELRKKCNILCSYYSFKLVLIVYQSLLDFVSDIDPGKSSLLQG